ncbi:hypothetical protein FKW77_008224 [Venturia effusa]|uniref:Uncharacterized protein n=1 Tax=Venturia effusa TaxID=50376 RepID=A0A517L1R7_9PEZI|nr:hypothetical protein FKW77_008224 [Venturia effusa]
MAIVKHPHEASAVTLESKHQRYDRLRRLFGIRRLGDLFPPGSTPNGAAHDPAYCSGDVLRDLCQIGEYLRMKGVGRRERRERVRKEFRAGEIVQHREIREMLSRVKKNEFEERLKNMKREPGLEEGEDDKMLVSTSNVRDESVFTTPALAFTGKGTNANAFMSDTQTANPRMEGNEETEEVKYADTPAFATAEQIRASFQRKRRDGSPNKPKRDQSVIEIKEESLSADSTDHFAIESVNHISNTTPRRNRVSNKNPLTPHSARRIAQDSNTAVAMVAARTVDEDDGDGLDDSAGKLREVTEFVENLDIMIENAQMKLRGEDVFGTDSLLTAARDLIEEILGAGRSGKEKGEIGLASRVSTGLFASGGVGTRFFTERESVMDGESSEDGV